MRYLLTSCIKSSAFCIASEFGVRIPLLSTTVFSVYNSPMKSIIPRIIDLSLVDSVSPSLRRSPMFTAEFAFSCR